MVALSDVWTVQAAKAQLSELLRRARAGEPQRIGVGGETCILISDQAWAAMQSDKLGAWLVESAPQGEEIELPSRGTRRGDPFAESPAPRRARK